MKSICIISQRYPCEANPSQHVFVKKIAEAMRDKGVEITIISPTPIQDKRYRETPVFHQEKTRNGNRISIYRPRYYHIATKNLGPIRFSLFTIKQWVRACQIIIEQNSLQFDAFYGHFVCLAGVCACKLAKIYNKPSFIAYGECSDEPLEWYGLKNVKRDIANVTGIIAVSTKNKRHLAKTGVVSEDKIRVFVNGVDRDVFYPRDRQQARDKFDIQENDFVVSFVGQFIQRKGIMKINEAVKRIGGIKTLYAGKGPEQPEGNHIAFKGILPSKEIPWLLSASDVFVFPSLSEGCSNALLEAMACGIPIIAADLPFNYDILDDKNSILIDGSSTDEIEAALRKLKNFCELRAVMGRESLERSKKLDINLRAQHILEFMGFM